MLADKQVRPTAMALAFVDAAPKGGQKWAKRLFKAVSKPGAGQVNERAVDAKVSYRTAQKLKNEGVL
jgi:hypothetical protein